MYTDKELRVMGLIAAKQKTLDHLDWLTDQITKAQNEGAPKEAKPRKPRRTKEQMLAAKAAGEK